MDSVDKIKTENLCIGCGVCCAICPKKAITFSKKNDGMYETKIDKKTCINCGLCYSVCPSNIKLNKSIEDREEVVNDFMIGNYKFSYACYSKDNNILDNSTSGGFITTTVKYLLESKRYDCAFLVKEHTYDKQIFAELIEDTKSLLNTSKSRYLPISQYKTAEYILNNKTKKVIIVGTPCSLSAINKLINIKKLNRNNYLFIGLFCDKTMTYNVIEYFQSHPMVKEKINKFYFRTKEKNSWPGDVGIEFSNKVFDVIPKEERTCIKEYFSPERCLYCIDKLNVLADIAVGDNYTNVIMQGNGSNSIVVRTELGESIWDEVSDLFMYKDCNFEEICKSQHLSNKYDNIINLAIKKSDNIIYDNLDKVRIDSNKRYKYNELLKKIALGAKKENKKIYRNTHSTLHKFINKIKRKIKVI